MTMLYRNVLVLWLVIGLQRTSAQIPDVFDATWMSVIKNSSKASSALIGDWEILRQSERYQTISKLVAKDIERFVRERSSAVLCELVQVGSIGEQHSVILLECGQQPLLKRWYPYSHVPIEPTIKVVNKNQAASFRKRIEAHSEMLRQQPEYCFSGMKQEPDNSGWACARYLIISKGSIYERVVGGASPTKAAHLATFVSSLLMDDNLAKEQR